MASNSSPIRTILIDNGTLNPIAWLNFERLAQRLSALCGHTVEPVSTLHSNKIPPEKIEGKRPWILEKWLESIESTEVNEIRVIPFFIGPSQAITIYLRDLISSFRKKVNKEINVLRYPFVFPDVAHDDLMLCQLLEKRIEDCRKTHELENPAVVLVDHGSPIPRVTFVRNYLAGQLKVSMGPKVRQVAVASMERRPGNEYRFNEPLLEKVFLQEGLRRGSVIIAMLFLNYGRHAGENGDVWTICKETCGHRVGKEIFFSEVLGADEGILPLLNKRMQMPSVSI